LNPRFDRGQGQAFQLCIIYLAHALEIAPGYRFPVFAVNILQGARQAFCQGFNGWNFYFNISNFVTDLIIITVTPKTVSELITRYLEQPGARIIQFAKPFALVNGLYENVLQQVLGSARIFQMTSQITTQFRLVPGPCVNDTVHNPLLDSFELGVDSIDIAPMPGIIEFQLSELRRIFEIIDRFTDILPVI